MKKEKKQLKIELEKLNKEFKIDNRSDTFLGSSVSFFKKGFKKEKRHVLKDITLKVYSGEVIGIIGRNGSGKSTILRILAQIYKPTSGRVYVNGNLFYLSSMGIGLMPKLTMKENIYLVGSVMGLSQADIKNRFNDIVEFSGLKDFVNSKVYQFSTGMTARLNFSITLFCLKHKNPDILILDEVFGSGADMEFENKAIRRMEELIRGGATVILVGHGLDLIQKHCDRVIWLDNGKIIAEGNPKEIIEKYKIG